MPQKYLMVQCYVLYYEHFYSFYGRTNFSFAKNVVVDDDATSFSFFPSVITGQFILWQSLKKKLIKKQRTMGSVDASGQVTCFGCTIPFVRCEGEQVTTTDPSTTEKD